MSETQTLPAPAGKLKPDWARDLPNATEDGDPIVYGARPLGPGVTSVEALDGYTLRVTFETGEIRHFDCRPLLDRGVFRVLADEAEFRRVQPINGGGGVGWASGADLSRDTLYLGEPV